MAEMLSHQPDLFDEAIASPPRAALPDGMALRPGMVDAAQEAALIAAIDASPLAPFAFQGWLGKRLTMSWGSAYDYQRGAVLPAPPIPGWLLPLRARMADWAEVDPATLVQALAIRYDPGAGIGWHRDRPQYGLVLGLSLGAPDRFRLRRRRADGGFDRFEVPLTPREAYRLDGPARSEWEHSILPATATRWSLTFRTLR